MDLISTIIIVCLSWAAIGILIIAFFEEKFGVGSLEEYYKWKYPSNTFTRKFRIKIMILDRIFGFILCGPLSTICYVWWEIQFLKDILYQKISKKLEDIYNSINKCLIDFYNNNNK